MLTKTKAIQEAQKKANLSKVNQVVFRWMSGIDVHYDYTHERLWGQRVFTMPVATHVKTVIPVAVDMTGNTGVA